MLESGSSKQREKLRRRKTELTKQLLAKFGFEKKFLIKECVEDLFRQNDILKMHERKGAVMVLQKKIEKRIEQDRVKVGRGSSGLKQGRE